MRKLTADEQKQWDESMRPMLERARKALSQPPMARSPMPAAASRDEIIEDIERRKMLALIDRCTPKKTEEG